MHILIVCVCLCLREDRSEGDTKKLLRLITVDKEIRRYFSVVFWEPNYQILNSPQKLRKARTAQTFRCVRSLLFDYFKNRSNCPQSVLSTKFTFQFSLQNLFKTCFYPEKYELHSKCEQQQTWCFAVLTLGSL
jgi:hypothetical protein